MKKKSRIGKYIFFAAGCAAMMCMTLSSYGIAAITPSLLESFGAMQHYTLTGLMSSVGMLLFLPIAGKLTDTIGRKPMLLVGGAITLIASLWAAFATDIVSFLTARALITVGSAFLTPIPSSTLPFLFEKKEIPTLFGVQAAFLALGTFFGFTVAGWCSDAGMTWLAVAYPGLLTAAAVAIMYFLCPQIERKPFPGMDYIGIILLCLIITPIVYISSFAPQIGWKSTSILLSAAVMIASFIAFIINEKRTAHPLINLKLFKNPVFTGVLLCTFLLVWYQTAMRSYIPLAVQNVMGYSAAISGVVSLPRSILNIIFPSLCGAWVAKSQNKRCWKGLFAAGLLIFAGHILITLTNPDDTLVLISAGLGLTGIAESFKGAAQTPALQSSVSKEELGSAMSLSGMFGSLGSTVSAACFGALHSSVMKNSNDIANMFNANRSVFIGAALSGIAVSLISFIMVRNKKQPNV